MEGFATKVEQLEPVVDQQTHISPEDYYRAMGLFDTDVALTDPYINDSYTKTPKLEIEIPPKVELDFEEWKEQTSVSKDPHPPGWMFTENPHPTSTEVVDENNQQIVLEIKDLPADPLAHIEIPFIDPNDHLHRLAKNLFMSGHADKDERIFHAQHQSGEIDRLPWHTAEHINNMPISDGEKKQLIERFVDVPSTTNLLVDLSPEPDNVINRLTGEVRGFGTQFPTDPAKGDMFLRVDRLPSALYKYNGINWIEVDKTLTDNHAYDEAYIDHLITKIDSGEYDPELLSDAERDSIERRLRRP